MTSPTKKPVRVYLRQDQLDALRALAEEQQVSVAALIRQGIDQLLADVLITEDPLWDIVGLGDSGLEDLALNHDHYLAEFEVQDNKF